MRPRREEGDAGAVVSAVSARRDSGCGGASGCGRRGRWDGRCRRGNPVWARRSGKCTAASGDRHMTDPASRDCARGDMRHGT